MCDGNTDEQPGTESGREVNEKLQQKQLKRRHLSSYQGMKQKQHMESSIATRKPFKLRRCMFFYSLVESQDHSTHPSDFPPICFFPLEPDRFDRAETTAETADRFETGAWS